MAELLATISTTISIAFQVKSVIEQIHYNREAHRLLVNRITNSLMQLKAEFRKLTKSSPGLTLVVSKLKSKLETALEKCKELKNRQTGFIVRLAEWFNRDSIGTALREVETQISHCFQEFAALGTIRIERKLGDHNKEVNRKLDELLRRTSSELRHGHDRLSSMNRNPAITPIAFPLQARTASDSSTNSSISRPGDLRRNHSSETGLSPSSINLAHSKQKALSVERLPQSNKSDLVSYSRKSSSKEIFFTHSADSLYESQANELDSECRRLRSIKHSSEALIPGRKAVSLRRKVHAADKSVAATAALARSLTYLARCLKDIHVDSHLTGTKVSVELMAVLSESVVLYKVAFKEDTACRIDLATALYNLSVRQSEPPKISSSHSSLLGTQIILKISKSRRLHSLTPALAAAEEAVHHFTVLEREDPDAFGMDLANALLNLSFILTDVESHETALTIARKAVMLAYRLHSTEPHTQERARCIRTLHKSLMRVSCCLDNLGRVGEAQDAESEANDVLKKPFFVNGV
ncbi:hypothetical protein FB446DRAFT_270204 [Lentinula raphanica]|nr:hypothetical protein FB446DRAFT_270204 [Lentinula raphanica]